MKPAVTKSPFGRGRATVGRRGRAVAGGGFKLATLVTVAVALLLPAGCGQDNDSAVRDSLNLAQSATTMVESENSQLLSEELLPGENPIAGVMVIPVLSAEHVEYDVQYSVSPPAGGPHFGIWQNCGFYTSELLDELAVHSMEHGAVWITYRADIPGDELDSLERLAQRNNYLLVSPYQQQPSPIVLTAWGRQLRLESIDDPRFVEFLETYVAVGPTTPEPGSVCFGGIGIAPDEPMERPQ